MPQVELTCVGDSKVSCEATTLIGSHPDVRKSNDVDPDFPPESISIPVDIGYWPFDIYPIVYDRDDSTKGTTNPKSHHQHNQNDQDHSSRRFSGNLKATAKAPIIALPNQIRHSVYLGSSARRRPLYRVRVSDPGSPEVSCFGKVLPQREKSTRRGAFWAAVLRCFSIPPRLEAHSAAGGTGRSILVREEENIPAAEMVPAPGLGGTKRFASGRRPVSWGGDGEDDGNMARSGQLDPP